MPSHYHEAGDAEGLRQAVRSAYAEQATREWSVAETIYQPEELRWLPAAVVSAALGLEHPVHAAQLEPGEVVLDLGCGGGIDTLLAARAVGGAGRAIGLDFTSEMLALARAGSAELRLCNVDFVEGSMEAVPLSDRTVDVVISNGVFNLAPDKDRVFAEARRVLRAGGRLVVGDMLLNAELPPALAADPRLWSG